MTRKHSRFISIISNRLLAILHGHASIDDYVMKEKEKYKPKASETTEEALPEDIPDEIRMLMNELLEDPAALETTEEAVPSKPSILCYTCGSHEHTQNECPESWRVIEHIDERMREETSPADNSLKEEVMNDEESLAEKNEDLLLDWTSQPTEEDVIVHAIPVCAPYAVLADYRYHVKLTAGKMKKGGLAKVVVDHWLKEKMTENEKRAIKNMSVDDLVTVIMNNSKVTIGSGKGKK